MAHQAAGAWHGNFIEESEDRARGASDRAQRQFRASLDNYRQDFIAFAVRNGVLRFGQFTTKAGRQSPYFFNAGLFNSGSSLGLLADFYAQALLAARRDGLAFDMLFGPAYKGITLASATAVAMAARGADLPYAYNRKEAKAHGEGGTLVGAPLAGRVVIVDDVLTDGASKREAMEIIEAAGATPVAVVIALDRMERKNDDPGTHLSAVQQFTAEYGLPVIAIATLDDLMGYLARGADPALTEYTPLVEAYGERYRARPASAATVQP
jgi:orotate phosphoribosyltransferase